MSDKKASGGKAPACSNAQVPDWIKSAVAELTKAFGVKANLIYAAGVAAFAKLGTAEQWEILRPVQERHSDEVKKELAGIVDPPGAAA